jgi:hypothetical protein
VTRRPSALERLLEVRETEESVARGALQAGLARLADCEGDKAQALAAQTAAHTRLIEYAQTTAEQRRGGFTIAARLLHADGERALAFDVEAATARLALATTATVDAEKKTDELRAAYSQAKQASEIVRRRVTAQADEASSIRARREEYDTLDAVLSRQASERTDD